MVKGFQIGEGDVNFGELSTGLNAACPDAPFISRGVAGGTKTVVRVFWSALKYLETYF